MTVATAGMPAESDAERQRRILRERAAALARPIEDAVADGQVDMLSFDVAGERYAVEARHVREVVGLPDVTRVGGAPPAIVGVINVRGEVLPVVDLRALTGVGTGGTSSHVLVLDGVGAPLGLLADAPPDLVTVPPDGAVEPEDGVGSDLVLRITPELVVLDGGKLLTDPRLFVEGDGSP